MNDEQRKFLERCRGMSDEELAEELKRVYPKAMKEIGLDRGILHKSPEQIAKETRKAQELNARRDEALRRS